MKKNSLSRDQRRRAKLAKRRTSSDAMDARRPIGDKYRKERFIQPMLHTELAILSTYIMSQKRLTDDVVKEGIKTLISQLDSGAVRFPPEDDPELFDSPELTDFLIWSIGDQWRQMADQGEVVSTKDLIGILRTVLDSLEVWTTGGKGSRGYLIYLEGFVKKLGVPVSTELSSGWSRSAKDSEMGLPFGLVGRIYASLGLSRIWGNRSRGN
ncbi:MAG: hypothetical protein U1D30_17115 [Planctomycetota bacterium]